MATARRVTFDDDAIKNQFQSEQPLPGAGLGDCKVIYMKELVIGAPLQPKSKIHRAEWHKPDGREETVAVKLDLQLNRREIGVLNGINHKNIVRFFGVIDEPPTTYGLVMEVCEKGCLFDYIHTESNRLDLAMALELAKGLVSGVRYLHKDAPDGPIKHNNLTSHEVILKEVDGILVPKISGFEYARQHSKTQMTTHNVGLHALLSPERIRGGRSSPESDIYSLGIIMSELVSRKVPFDGIPTFEACYLVTDKKQRPEIPSCPKDLTELIEDCWEEKPNKRPTAGEVEYRLERISEKVQRELVEPESEPVEPESEPAPPQPPIHHDPPSRQLSEIEDSAITEVGHKLGTGRIGDVRKAVFQEKPVVVKGVNQRLKDRYLKYVAVVFPVSHENIVKVLGATSDYIVMEKMEMNLECRLKKGPITDNNELLKIAIGVASGLHHLHTLASPTVHGSVHPRNVFLDSANNAKICDFGYVILDRDVGLMPTTGFEDYHAPEGQLFARYCYGADIFGVGILLVEMHTLERDLAKLKTSWPQLHKHAKKYAKAGQDGMYQRGKLSMEGIIKDLKKLRK